MNRVSRGCSLALIIAVGVLASVAPASATQLAGGKALMSVQLPSLLEPGALNVTLHTRSFAKNLPDFTLSNGTGALSFNFGFTKHVELGYTQIFYQDLNISALDQEHKEQIPDDAYIRLKVGEYPFKIGNAGLKFGVLNQLRLRTGIVDNIYLEPYVSKGIEWEINLLTSLYTNPLYQDQASAFHLNLGYLNHNDAGLGQSPLKAAQAFTYGLAYVYPTRRCNYFLETSGSIFMRYPAANAYSRENCLWLTPGVSYKVFYGMNVNAALDLRLYEEADKTTYAGMMPIPREGPENYPAWRFNLNVSISPSTAFYRQPTFTKLNDANAPRQALRQNQNLFEWVVDQPDGLEAIGIELEKIRAERIKAEQELEKLKAKLNK